MANPTYKLIASYTVGAGGAASIDFTSIPATYTDLVVKLCTRGTDVSSVQYNVNLTFNGSSSGYSGKLLYGQGSGTPSSANGASTSINMSFYHPSGASTASTFGNAELYIPNYAGSNNKSVSSDFVTENNATANFMGLTAGLWSNSAAINRVTFTAQSPNDIFAQYSTAYLYGISNS